jgi:hypothetical protein
MSVSPQSRRIVNVVSMRSILPPDKTEAEACGNGQWQA